MSYQEFKPHYALASYIDAYWIMKSEDREPVSQRIMPDGCIDIMLNLGSDFLTDNGKFTMKNESAYILGTMTQYVDVIRRPDTHLLGIRFKPLGFSAFYKFSSLHEITNKTVEFEKSLAPEIRHANNHTPALLDKFFLERLTYHHFTLAEILNSIRHHHGKIAVDKLARQHFTTNRQLERNFKQYLGISPKEYINFVRYQSAVAKIKQKPSQTSLLHIAFDTGFYDHSHLTNEIKKYSGLLPSEL